MLSKEDLSLTAVLDLEVEDAMLVRRVLGRLIHPPSGRTYHEEFHPPRTPMTDDVRIPYPFQLCVNSLRRLPVSR